MTGVRHQVDCLRCGAALGRYVARSSQDLPRTRFELQPTVRLYAANGRTELHCPSCGRSQRIVLANGHVTRSDAV
jgi:hypothetical protein